MSAARVEPALPFIAWSRIFSPLVPAGWRDEAWGLLGLPGRWSEAEPLFWKTFGAGLPVPPVPLQLHAALGRDGSSTREDWMRVIAHLGLVWGDRSLPPDHLAAACEVLACAIERDERLLVRALGERYLRPWCAQARRGIPAEAAQLAPLPALFERDLRSAEESFD